MASNASLVHKNCSTEKDILMYLKKNRADTTNLNKLLGISDTKLHKNSYKV